GRLLDAVRPGDPRGTAGRAVDELSLFGTAPRGVAAHHVEPGEVQAVVGVQVREHDRVDRQRIGMPLQATERPAPQVEDQAPGAALVLGLEQVAGCGAVRTRERPRATDDGQEETHSPALPTYARPTC